MTVTVATFKDPELGRTPSSNDSLDEPICSSTSEITPLVNNKLLHERYAPKFLHSPEPPTPNVHNRFGFKAFLADINSIHSATVPVSLAIATIIGILCGIAAWLYYALLEFLLHLLWHTIPESLAATFPTAWTPAYYWLWIPFVGMSCAFLVGISIMTFGFPGDLPYTIKCVHKLGYVPMDHAPSMVVASQLSILGGGSLGPEAPLVAICASIAGWVSMRLFKQRFKNVVRKHTLCGMACALSAFFGVPLGGSLFALEINNRLGLEYFEHALEAIASGTICLVVFRTLAQLPIGPIYTFTAESISNTSGGVVMMGALFGLIGAGIASLFAHFHWFLLGKIRQVGWNTNPLKLSLFGGMGICILAVLIPQTMFWGETEMQTIGSLSPASKLDHIWPTSGLLGFEITNFWTAFVTGVAKLVAVSFTVAGGYRGGFIFPFFAAGSSFGRAIWFLFPSVSPVVVILSMAAGINVAITRTAISTPLILCSLAGEGNSIAPVLAASLTSIFATYYMVCIPISLLFTSCRDHYGVRPSMNDTDPLTQRTRLVYVSLYATMFVQPFILTQQGREDVFESQLHCYTFQGKWGEEGESETISEESSTDL